MSGSSWAAELPAAQGKVGMRKDGRTEARLAARYDEILRQHGAALRRVAASYEADPSQQEDLYQEILLAVWRALPGFRGDASVRTFVFRIAHNRGLRHGWRAGRLPGALSETAVVVDPRPTPEAETVRSERRARLRNAVRSLPPVPRQVVTLSLEGLSHREIGEVLGMTENNVAVRLSRARQALRRALEMGGGGR